MTHPLYDDESLVAQASRAHLDAGRSVFQIFQLAANEREHSRRVLRELWLPTGAEVLSLGCGVGGMEKHWHDMRPDLHFTLVNKSQAQLDLCVCPGERICDDLVHYLRTPHWRFHCVVFGYVLGHLRPTDARRVLQHTRCNRVVVLDVIGPSKWFTKVLHYRPLNYDLLPMAGFRNFGEHADWHVTPAFDNESAAVWAALNEVEPAFWVR